MSKNLIFDDEWLLAMEDLARKSRKNNPNTKGCNWPTWTTGFNSHGWKQCGRCVAVVEVRGMVVCSQHREKLIAATVALLEEHPSMLTRDVIKIISEAVRRQIDVPPRWMYRVYDQIEEEMIERLRSRKYSPRFREALNDLLVEVFQ